MLSGATGRCVASDERSSGIRDGDGVIVRPKHPRRDPRAVHEQGQLGGQAIRFVETSLAGEFCEALECLPLVCERHPMPGVIEFWKLGRSP